MAKWNIRIAGAVIFFGQRLNVSQHNISFPNYDHTIDLQELSLPKIIV